MSSPDDDVYADDDAFTGDDETTIGAIPAPRSVSSRRPVLAVLQGDDTRRFHELTTTSTVMGRDLACELSLPDATSSRRHAVVRMDMTREGPRVSVEDLGSMNGTFVNGERIHGRVVLVEHDKLRVGATLFAYLLRDELELEADRRLLHMATYDALTGILNRNAILRELAREHERARRYNREFSVLMIDLDHFKQINDTWGHPAGDRVLAVMGRILRNAVRACDYTGRYGGEECLVILVETPAATAAVVAERIRAAVEAEDFGIDRPITVSLGVAATSAADPGPERMLERADVALYAAKGGGRNRVAVAD
jgi:diguanylate cyclase (GGDEF)-like protein